MTISPTRYGLRAPKGGATVAGKLYKGGQFCLPFDPANPHGVEAQVVEAAAPIRVEIAGSIYDARPIPAGECGSAACSVRKVGSGASYDVILNHFGVVTCDCPDYLFRHEGQGSMCKHGKALVALGLIPPPAPNLLPLSKPASAPRPPAPTRPRRFVPSADEFRQAAAMFAR